LATSARENREWSKRSAKHGTEKNKKYYDRSQYVIENKEGHVQNEAKNEPKTNLN